jgi:hypothetical protein
MLNGHGVQMELQPEIPSYDNNFHNLLRGLVCVKETAPDSQPVFSKPLIG